jgi:hypothetical protein
MTIEQFAAQHKVKIKRDDCNDPIIPGKVGHIGDGYSGGLLSVYVDAETPRAWTYAKRKLVAVGMRIKQNGDADGVVMFDPANLTQVRIALKVAGIKTKRKAAPPSPAQLAARAMFADRRRNALQSA